ncbi:MAG: DUF4331 family protein [Rhodanobacter sp.]
MASSHREASFISTMPQAGASDFQMFMSYEPGRAGYGSLPANDDPLQKTYSGPCFHSLDDNAVYDFKVDNDGDALSGLSFRFTFTATYKNLAVPAGGKQASAPLIHIGSVSGSDQSALNRVETATVNGRHDEQGRFPWLANTTGGPGMFVKPVDNIGKKSIADDAAYARKYVYNTCAAGREFHRNVPRLALALMLLLVSGLSQAVQNIPYVPASADVVLQRVPPNTDPRVRQFDLLRRDLAGQPGDVGKAVRLAHAYIDYGRATGDARFLGRAMAVIEPWMREPAPPIPVLLVHATIQQSRHFFQTSREELNAILKRDPDNVQAWLTLATVAMVQGDEVLANRACVQLANDGGDLMGLVCTASLRSLTGQAKQAYALLSIVQDPGQKAPPSIKAWIAGLQADTAARMGETDEAEKHYRQALQWAPDDNFLLADYADFLLDQGRPAEVIHLLREQAQSDTSYLRLVMAEVALAKPQAARDTALMSDRFAALDARGSQVFQREQARFALHVLHDPSSALTLAQQNWTVQREPADVRILLEAALAANQPAAAQPVLDFLARTHLSDVAIDPLAARARTQLTSLATAATVTAPPPKRSVP